MRIKLGLQEKLFLGNIDAQRDWGHAKDYVEAMWLMLQQDKPEDFVIASGKTQTVRSFVERAFAYVDMQIEWKGKGVEEKGVDATSGKTVIEIDARYFRPTEVDLLLGDPSKAKTVLKWKPKNTLETLVEEMMEADLNDARKAIDLRKEGHDVRDYNE